MDFGSDFFLIVFSPLLAGGVRMFKGRKTVQKVKTMLWPKRQIDNITTNVITLLFCSMPVFHIDVSIFHYHRQIVFMRYTSTCI
jgi:hypothetical protein